MFEEADIESTRVDIENAEADIEKVKNATAGGTIEEAIYEYWLSVVKEEDNSGCINN